MGWIILAIVLALLAAPLFVPLRVDLQLAPGERDWRALVGPLTVAPETTRHMARYRARLRRILRPFAAVARVIGQALGLLYAGWLLLMSLLSWPLGSLLQLLRRGFRPRRPRPPPPPPSFSIRRHPDAPHSALPGGELEPPLWFASQLPQPLRLNGQRWTPTVPLRGKPGSGRAAR